MSEVIIGSGNGNVQPVQNEAPQLVSGYERITKGGLVTVQVRSLMEEIRETAAARVYARSVRIGVNEFLELLVEESIGVWLEFFPRICQEMRRVNYEKAKILKETSERGRFTESYGWSASRDFKFEYEYTPEFYFFMQNYVYEGFFDNENKRWYRLFMKKIMRGDDPMESLIWIKKRYGSNSQAESVVN